MDLFLYDNGLRHERVNSLRNLFKTNNNNIDARRIGTIKCKLHQMFLVADFEHIFRFVIKKP